MLQEMIKRISIEDPIESHSRMAIEVVIELDDDSKRCCYFFTPAGLSNCGDFVEGTQVRLHYGAPHMFVVSEISTEIIEAALVQIEKRGELEQCTLPIV